MIPWIKMRTNLRDDPRVRLIAKRTGCNALSVIGGLYMLWSLGDQYSVDGRLVGYSADDLDKLFGKAGFSSALSQDDVGWLVIESEALIIPRFEEHNGISAKARSQGAKRVQSHRRRNGDVTDESLQNREQMKRKSKKENTSTAGAVADAGPKGNGRMKGKAHDADLDAQADPTPAKAAKPKKGPMGDHAALIEHFRQRWEARYAGRTFHFGENGEGGKNGAHVKAILDRCEGDLDRAKATVDAYLDDAKEFLTADGTRHPLGLLISGFDKYQAPRAGVRTSNVLERTVVAKIP